MVSTPFIVADTLCRTGEGPIWSEIESVVYWVDIPTGTLYRYDPRAETYDIVFTSDESIGGFTLQSDGSMLLFQEHGAIRHLRDGQVKTLRSEIEIERGGRFNDVIADPEGRVFCGTMPIGEVPGRLYRLDLDGSLHLVVEDAGLSNGMGFSPDLRTFYHADSRNRWITMSDYDRVSGELTNRRVWHRTADGDGVPDGLTVDVDGCVWVAQWDGNCLIQLDPGGEELRRVVFPAKKVSSITFGGADYRTVWVTTANVEGRESEGNGAGALFQLQLDVVGRAEFLSQIRID
jgi:D-xylonolactonase